MLNISSQAPEHAALFHLANPEPCTACPAHANPHPAVRRHLEAGHDGQQEGRTGNEQECRRKWARCSRKRKSSPEHRPAPTAAAQDHQPVEEDVKRVVVPRNIRDLARHERDGKDDY